MDEFDEARTLETIAIEDMSLEQLEAVCKNRYVTRSLKKAAAIQHRKLSNELDMLDDHAIATNRRAENEKSHCSSDHDPDGLTCPGCR